ncbi:MAG: hypothetical protein WD208_13740 [Dehalococcoidia bacterium]
MNSKQSVKRRHRPVTPADSQEWFRQYEGGRSVADIARSDERDPRTVRKGIASVQAEVEKTAVRREAMKDALKRHLGRLIEDIDLLGRRAGSKAAPSLDNLWTPGGGPWELLPYRFSVSTAGEDEIRVRYEAEGSAGWAMLQSHFEREPVWKRFDDWKSSVARLSTRLIDLKHSLTGRLESMAGLKPGGEDVPGLEVGGVRELHQAVINKAYGRTPDFAAVLSSMKTTASGVNVGGQLLVAMPEDPDQLADHIRRKLGSQDLAGEIDSLQTAAEQVLETGSALATEVEYIVAVPFPGGECRACRRLGH